MIARIKLLALAILAVLVVSWAHPAMAGDNMTQHLIRWFHNRQKIANLQVGTIEEVGDNKVLISITHHWPKPKDELVVYSYEPTRDPSMYQEVGVVRVESRTWNAVQARIIVEEDFAIKKGDLVRYPPVSVISLECPDETRETPQYREVLNALVSNGFTVVEGGELSGFPYGYIVNFDISDKIESIKVISIFDNHLFYTDSTTLE